MTTKQKGYAPVYKVGARVSHFGRHAVIIPHDERDNAGAGDFPWKRIVIARGGTRVYEMRDVPETELQYVAAPPTDPRPAKKDSEYLWDTFGAGPFVHGWRVAKRGDELSLYRFPGSDYDFPQRYNAMIAAAAMCELLNSDAATAHTLPAGSILVERYHGRSNIKTARLIDAKGAAEIQAQYNTHKAWLGDHTSYKIGDCPADKECPANDRLSALETFQWMTEKPAGYFVYIDEARNIMTTWCGDVLGRVEMGRPYIDNFGGRRVPLTAYGNNGQRYHGTYYSSAGQYARIRAAKAKG